MKGQMNTLPHSPKCNYIAFWYASTIMYHMNQVKKLVSKKDNFHKMGGSWEFLN